MNKSIIHPLAASLLLLAATMPVAHTQTTYGNLTVTGSTNLDSDTLTIGSRARNASEPGIWLNFSDGTPARDTRAGINFFAGRVPNTAKLQALALSVLRGDTDSIKMMQEDMGKVSQS